MVAEMNEGIERYPEHATMHYHLACAQALAGREDDALAHLQRAVELRPGIAESARDDPDLASLRQLPGFPA